MHDASLPRPDELASRMMPTVRRIAQRLIRRLPRHVPIDDLLSAGHKGLALAIARADEARAGAFETYAERHVRGAMLDELRSRDPMSRDRRQQQRRIAAAIRALSSRLRRAPNSEEIAAELGISLDAYWEQAASVREEAIDDEVHVLADTGAEPADERLCRDEREEIVRDAMAKLPARDRQVLEMAHIDGLTLREIGDRLGVTESRVCQIRTRAVAQIRAHCLARLDGEPARPLAA
jgi:RNA polymerase sigma factor for flagellar operon FliA